MNILPNELIIEIFTYLEPIHLFNVALTCKKYNEIISNTTEIMKKFTLTINQEKSKLITYRKYQNIYIRFIDKRVVKFIEHIGESIVNIEMWLRQFNLNDLRKILMACPRLKKLCMRYSNVFGSFDKKPLPKLQLDYLDYGNSAEVLKVLMESNVEDLGAEFDETDVNSSIFKNFIKKQKHLKSLEIMDFDNDLFNDESLTDVEFRLKTLKVYSSNIENLENFKKFLQQQISLHEVIFLNEGESYTKVLNILRQFPNVKKLRFNRVKLDFKPMPFVETLTLGCSSRADYRMFHELFPNVSSLTIIDTFSIHIVKNFLNENRREIKIPNVKNLMIQNVFQDGCPFECENLKLENLTIERCHDANWLHEWLKSNEIKLKSFKISSRKMKQSVKQYLESLTVGDNKRIDTLEILVN